MQINLPENLYRRLERIAKASNRKVDEVVAEHLHATLPPVDDNQESAAMEIEEAAFQSMHAELLQKYPGEFVAVFQGEVVDHDTDQSKLLQRRAAKYPGKVVMIAQVLPEVEEVYYHHSIRWISKSVPISCLL
jgi:hypothetical protein